MLDNNKFEKVSDVLEELKILESKTLEYIKHNKEKLDEEKNYVLNEVVHGLPSVIDIIDCMIIGGKQEMIDKHTLNDILIQHDVDDIAEVISVVANGELELLVSMV